jgi:hypothetical protein
LEKNADPKLRVFVVWEPILPTDWRPPSGSTLKRVADRRAGQFWDPKHVIAQELRKMLSGKSGQPEPSCCTKDGFFWDDVVLYAPHSRWNDALAPQFWNGPVVRVMPGLDEALHKIFQP